MTQKLQHRKRGLLLALFLLAAGLNGAAIQNTSYKNTGFKYLKNYSTADYKHHAQNWTIVQDSRGIIYVGNQAGVLEFDGISWRIILIPNWSVRSMAIDDTGVIYIGGKDEIGFLIPDAKGALYYVSLLPEVDINKRKFSTVWITLAANNGVYFMTSKYLMRWNARTRKMKTWGSNKFFRDIFYVKGNVFINEKSIGLRQIVKDSLQSIPGGETFADDKIYMMVPFNSRGLLLATDKIGMCFYDGIKATPYPTEANDYLKEKQLYHGIRISSGNLALATRQGGLVIIDSLGHLKHIYDKSSGLQDNNVKHVFEDSTGCLWLALNNGISKIEYNSPISHYDDRNRLEGVVYSIVRHRRDLYTGTSSGLFFLPSAGGPVSSHQFRPIAGITGNCWSLLSTGDSLIAAADSGLFQVDNQRVRKVTGKRSYCLSHSRHETNRIWAGIDNGIYSLYFKDNLWQPEYLFDQINMPIRTIIEDKQGYLWLGTLTRGAARVEFTGPDLEPIVKSYNTSRGLPEGEIHVFKAAGHVIFATEQGLFRFNESKQVFVPDYTLGKTFAGGGANVFRMAEDVTKHIWFHSRARNYHAEPRADGSYAIDHTSFLRLPVSQANTIYPEDDFIWFGSVKGLICYDKRVKKNYHHKYRAFIRKIQLANSKSLIFDGYQIKSGEKPLFPVIDYRDRNLRFHYAAPFFENEGAVRYSYFLEGGDDGWSDWTDETRKDYTNLDGGVYTFRVRAKNVYEHLSEEAVFQFKVLPPWYQTWWAFLIYAVTALLIMYLLVRWRSWKLVQEKQKLERIIEERTQQINQQKQQLLEQAEKLKEMDKVKSRFFANISHEFRTPLTLIMGPLEQMLPGCREEKQKKQLKMMLRNSQRLLALINQLLELAKFDNDKMTLRVSRQNIVPLARNMVMCFESLARQNKVDLIFKRETEEISLYLDPEKLEKIITNLLANAFNYTPADGKITVSLRKAEETLGFPGGCVEISIRDTGTGIPQEQLPYIFHRFYRGESGNERKQEGAGIGLALTKELIGLHHGEIDVRSRVGKNSGTEFTIRIPLAKDRYHPGEIVHHPQTRAAVPQHLEKTGNLPEDPGFYRAKPTENGDESGHEADEKGMARTEPAITTGEQEKEIILVVEDNADVRDYIRGALEPQYIVKEAADGKDGIKKAREIIPDLVISDIMMPGIDGYELCRQLKEDVHTSHIPIIILTAKASEESILTGLATRADDYIIKPFSINILKARISNLIELRRQMQLKRKRRMALEPAEISVTSIDETFYKELQGVIEANLDDPDFNVEAMSKKLYMNRATLYRKIHALTGETPTDFIRSYRLKRAAQLLKAKVGNVTEVSFRVGFSNSAYFTRCFKDKFHRVPSDFLGPEEPGED